MRFDRPTTSRPQLLALVIALALFSCLALGPLPAQADEMSPEVSPEVETLAQEDSSDTAGETPEVPEEPKALETTPEADDPLPDETPEASPTVEESVEDATGETEPATPQAPVPEEAAEPAEGNSPAPEADQEPTSLVTQLDQPSENTPYNEPALEDQATGGLPATPAGASDKVVTNGKTYVIQSLVASNRVVKAKDTDAGAKAVIAKYAGSREQRWIARRESGSSWYRLVLSGSQGKLVLGVKGSKVCVTANPTGSKSLLDVLWAFVSGGDDTYQLVNAATGKALGATKKKVGTSLGVYAASKAATKPASQRFRMVQANPSVGKGTTGLSGAYTLSTASNTSLVVGAKGSSKKSGGNVVLQTASENKVQKIYLQEDGKGYYIVWVLGSGKVLDMKTTSILPGNNVLQRSYTGSRSQRWSVVAKRRSDGTYATTLKNRATGLVLGVSALASGANIAGVTKQSSQNRALSLKREPLISAGITVITPLATNTRYLTVPGAATGTSPIKLYSSQKGLSQRFEMKSVGKNLWRIRTASSGGWLTWVSGSKVCQMGSSATAASKADTWKAVWKNGGVALVNRKSKKALQLKAGKTKNGTLLVAAAHTAKDAQHFLFRPARLVEDGIYFVDSKFKNKRLVAEGNSELPANIINHKKFSSSTASEKFQFKKTGDAYRITNVGSGLALAGGGPADSGGFSNVSQKRSSGSKDQLWRVQIGDGGYLEIVNAATGNYLVSRANEASADGVWRAYNVVERVPADKAKFKNGVGWTLTPTTGKVKSNPLRGTTVLLIGNSFTHYNDMYTMLKAELGTQSFVDQATSGGKTLGQHLDTNAVVDEDRELAVRTLKKLYTGDWDYVVLQEQSTGPIDSYSSFLSNLTTFCNLTRKVQATPILYATWAFRGTVKKKSDGSYDSIRSEGTLHRTAVGKLTNPDYEYTLDDMHRDLQDAFSRAAKATKAAIANVGQAFADEGWKTSLYHTDDKHPSAEGSRLAASVIAGTIRACTV